MTTKKNIETFISSQPFAVVGVSRNSKKFGNAIYNELEKKNFKIFPVNPNMDSLNGQPCYPDLQSLPEKAGGVIICVSPEKTLNVVKDAEKVGIKNIWMQQGTESDEAIEFCKEKKLTLITKACILMFIEPVSFPHNFHRWLLKVFGKLPK